MELFDPNGDQPWRNVIWIIVLAIAGIVMTTSYNDSVRREQVEAKYESTTAYLTNAEEWVRVRKKGGREQSRKNYYKINYTYIVDGRQLSGNAQQDEYPQQSMTVYYDPKNPSKHVLKRHNSDSALTILIVGGLFVFAFLGVNVYLFKSKRAKLGIDRSGIGSFR